MTRFSAPAICGLNALRIDIPRVFLSLLVLSTLSFFPSSSAAQSEPQTEILRKITVSGGSDNVDKVPGSTYFLDREQLEDKLQGADDISRALRDIPGINIQEEEGYGNRPNIGFRGTDTERSANITLMEDGVLAAPAPYSAPSAYYFPAFGRISGLEVVKGASQTKYGPNTIGGSINFLSTPIPTQDRIEGNIRLGENDTTIAHLNGGSDFSFGGFLLETYQARTDGFKDLPNGDDTGFDIQDYIGKFRLNTDPNEDTYHELEFKGQYYEQDADETYVGLTDFDFDIDPFQRYAGTQLDNLLVDRDLYQLRYYGDFGDGIDLSSTAYYTYTKRNWRKLESVGGASTNSLFDDPGGFASELAWLKGLDSDPGAFSLRNNRRQYRVWGIDSVLGLEFETGQAQHELQLGVRYHEDYEDRFQEEDSFTMANGSLVLDSLGAPGSNANRKGEAKAWAFYAHDDISIDQFTVSPGIRFESIDYTRDDWGKNDPSRSGSDLNSNSSSIDQLIPGIGVIYDFANDFKVFAGLHKGFSPPGPQSNDEVDSEESLNYELGANYTFERFWSELILFFNDYDNLLGQDTVSGGGSGTGDLFNAGQARSYGLEAALRYDLLPSDSAISIPLSLTYTFTDAEFRDDFDSDLFGLVSSGDDIPYVPQHQISTGIGLAYDIYSLDFDGHYVDAMPTVAGAAGSVSSDKTDSYFVFDLSAQIEVAEKTNLYASIENLFDEEYVVARRPAGARPGRPQTVFAGLRFEF